MPRFRITKELPIELRYRAGVAVTIDVIDGIWGGQKLLARRTQPPPGSFLYLCENDTSEPLAPKLARGFDITAGSPAEKILRTLVARGYAVEDSTCDARAPC
jgi:hypothetical protein